tara:strand:- start:134 stop:652 length:519 start_codon:yes stop_codon:yes gene_type:complete
MKELTISLLAVTFLVLIGGSIKIVSADHLQPDIGIFKNEREVNSISTEDSKYQIYLTVEIRNAQGELISISDALHGKHIAHEITDHIFNEKLGEREIITIDNVKYEKVQFVSSYDFLEWPSSFIGIWYFNICGDIGGHSNVCVPIFHANTASMYVEEGDDIKNHWTILREMN